MFDFHAEAYNKKIITISKYSLNFRNTNEGYEC